MKIPTIRGVIDRRILVNFRVDPDALKRLLPEPFRPKIVNDSAMAGICLIRLKQIRPRFMPPFAGISSENAAHRIAVEWISGGKVYEGVYVLRRDTSSWLNSAVGGRLFPGVHHHAHFRVDESGGHYRIALDSDDKETHVAVEGQAVTELPATSMFASLEEASEFFERGALGYSPAAKSGTFDGLELHCFNWQVSPLAVERVESSFFENRDIFPPGAVELDCALLMCGIQHDWRSKETLCSGCVGV